MRSENRTLLGLLVLVLFPALLVLAQPRSKDAGAARPAGHNAQQDEAMRVEGEKRFHANCSRCHMAPHKFPPRIIATVERHMRVRATITEDDMRFILYYLTQ